MWCDYNEINVMISVVAQSVAESESYFSTVAFNVQSKQRRTGIFWYKCCSSLNQTGRCRWAWRGSMNETFMTIVQWLWVVELIKLKWTKNETKPNHWIIILNIQQRYRSGLSQWSEYVLTIFMILIEIDNNLVAGFCGAVLYGVIQQSNRYNVTNWLAMGRRVGAPSWARGLITFCLI